MLLPGAMNSSLATLFCLTLASTAGCGGKAASESDASPAPPGSAPTPAEVGDHGFGEAEAGWPETIETTPAWPWFGSAGSGVVIAPRWVAPARFGCARRVYVRTEPQRDLAPGDGPRVAYGTTLDETCSAPGATIAVVDEPGYDLARVFTGSCEKGFSFETTSTLMASVSFAPSVACAAFEASRTAAAAAATRRRQRVTLRLVSVGNPSVGQTSVVEVTAFEEADPDSRYGVTER